MIKDRNFVVMEIQIKIFKILQIIDKHTDINTVAKIDKSTCIFRKSEIQK